MPVSAQEFALLRHFTSRALRERFEGTLTGAGWAVLQPLIMLGVYSLLFVTVLRARLPESIGLGFVPFLAVGLWPWTAFAESLTQGTTAIQDNASLLSKVALPRAVLVLSRVAAAFALHALGFVLILVLLAALGHPLKWSGLPIALGLMCLLAIAAAGLALALAAIQVFVRDLAQIIGQVLTVGFFLTPIFYPREMLPERLRPVLDANPMTAFVEAFRWSLFGAGEPGFGWWALLWFPPAALALGWFVFQRLSKHFEDFL
ncbi:MAG: ABC transporter permease [Lysobacterales bacterium]